MDEDDDDEDENEDMYIPYTLQEAAVIAVNEVTSVSSCLYKHRSSIGKLCKVYWDTEDTWFDCRILAYDDTKDLHYLYYDADNTTEWADFKDDAVLMVYFNINIS